MNLPKRQNFQPTEKPLVIVGSKNPVKIYSAEDAFTLAFNKGFHINGVSSYSDVSAQPKGDEETRLGAKNRALSAQRIFPEGDFWVGIEGGVATDELGMNAFAWIYIINSEGKSSQAKTAIFYLPKAIAELIDSGMELGHADDQFFDQENSKQRGGSVGILTKGALDRRSYYAQAIVLALIPFLNKNLF
ncbi:inosine/xanthosine triphosphatase [Algoriphagus sp.]|uniref:inosine/xanthosine triphosphatase n=1 Tax=Algoriphagus sp. TaxID=1872435 RepID=UPI002625FE14|nr:inosine/xanthosine triphosphatase [Algoriphagus sp.]